MTSQCSGLVLLESRVLIGNYLDAYSIDIAIISASLGGLIVLQTDSDTDMSSGLNDRNQDFETASFLKVVKEA